VNEIELLRSQLATERSRVREIAGACAAAACAAPAVPAGAASEALRLACTEYLGCVLDWFDERDARLGDLVDPAALAALGSGGRGREALERLAAHGGAPEGWQALAQFIDGPWDARRRAVERLLAANPRVADWRTYAGIDADSICRERALYARCRAALPAGG
jgi:hypothetical protein